MEFYQFLRVACIAILAMSSLQGSDNARIVAVVNQKAILHSELSHRVKLALLSSGAHPSVETVKALEKQLLQIMIDESILLQLGDEFKISIDDAMINDALGDIENQNNMEKGGLKQLLSKNNIPFEVMKQHIKSTLIRREYIRGRFKEVIQISEEEVNRALQEMETAKKYSRYLLGEIFIRHSPSALQTAKKIGQQLAQGAQFTALAQQFSNAPSGQQGGDIGWVTEKNLPFEAKHALTQLSIGGVTSPLSSDKGVHIYVLRDRLEPGQLGHTETFMTFKQVFLPISRDAFEFEVRDAMNRAQVLAQSIKSCGMVEKLVGSKHGQIQTMTKVPLSRLPNEMQNLLAKIPENSASKPLLTERGAMILVMCKKKTINPQEPKPDEIREMLLDRKLQGIAEREMRNLRRFTHIENRLHGS